MSNIDLNALKKLPLGIPFKIVNTKLQLRMKSNLIGMIPNQSIIIAMPSVIIKSSGNNADGDSELFSVDDPVHIEYMLEGTIYTFEASIIATTTTPVKLLYISYPDAIQDKNLRQMQRIDCHLPAKLSVFKRQFDGLIIDISLNGCRLRMKNELKFTEKIRIHEIDLPITVEFELPGIESAFIVKGSSRNVVKDAQTIILGVAFTEFNMDSRMALEEFLQSFLDVSPDP